MRLISHALRCHAGSTAVEFAFVLPAAVVLLFGGLQLGLIFEGQAILDTSAEIASRQIATGAVQSQGLTKTQFKAGVCATIPAFLKCADLMVEVRVVTALSSGDAASPTINYDSGGQIVDSWAFNPGKPADLVVMRLMYPWPTVVVPGLDLSNLRNGKRLLVATNVIRNEDYQ